MAARSGLSSAEAQQLLRQNGPNELPSARPRTIFQIALQVVKEPMFLLLIGCGILYLMLGDYQEGIVLSSSIFLIIAITFFQYRKTERALDALRNLSSPRALVVRDGSEVRIAGREVVCGDTLVLQEGDRVAADACIIDSENLLVDESLLTGESVPVAKHAIEGPPVMVTPGGENQVNVFSGTMVLRGRGHARVMDTGSHTAIGRIGRALEQEEQGESRLQAEMKMVVRRFGIAGILVSAIVILSYFLSRGNLLHALLTGLSSAMAILPEEFPVVLTVFMALGAWRLSGRHVLTRNPAAIETLGAATVLCSDKTGTITENRMRVAVISDGVSFHTMDDSDAHLRNHPDLVRIAALACPEHPVDPMEKAIRAVSGGTETCRLIKTYPLTRERLSMTQVSEQVNGTELQPARVIAAKGAVEAISLLCHLPPALDRTIRSMADKIAADGLRVIAVAQGMAEAGDLPEDADGFEYRFLGLIGLEDPIRAAVPEAMEECKKAGVRVIMITGDYPVTAASIGAKIGLDHQRIMTGSQLSELDDAALQAELHHTSVFARVVPEQKLRIVKALKANGEVVAMTGDGVNDAPALKAAHIGIAMGQKGTDVAREAASLVLLDDNFASIVRGLRLGRRIYDNLQKAMRYILAIHIPIIGLALLPAFVPEWPTLLFPLHIVFMELIIDPVCSIAFENEPDEAGLMNRPPRRRDAEFFGNREIMTGVVSGLILLATVLSIYFASLGEGHSEQEVRALAYTSLILCNIGFVLTSLSRTRNIFKVLGEHNASAKIILTSALIMLGLTLGSGPVRDLFQFEVPGWQHFLPPFAGAAIMVALFEARKWLVNRNLKTLPYDQPTSIETGQ